MPPSPKQNKIIGIIAPIGTGKTTECVNRLRGLDRVVIFDTLGEDAYALHAREIIFGNPQALAQEIAAPQFCVAYRTINVESGFESCAKLVYLRGNCTFIIEEIDQICGAGYESEMLHSLLNYGRHREVSIIYLSRRFATISRSLTANTSEFVFFRVSEPIDLAAIRERCGPDVSEKVASLRPLQVDPEVIPGERLIWNNRGEWSVQDGREAVRSASDRELRRAGERPEPLQAGVIQGVKSDSAADEQTLRENQPGD